MRKKDQFDKIWKNKEQFGLTKSKERLDQMIKKILVWDSVSEKE